MTQIDDPPRSRLKIKSLLVPPFIRTWREIWKEHGLKALLKEKGLKVVVVVFMFYLIRDCILYLLLPYLAAKGLFGF